jgi:hypothetical protein
MDEDDARQERDEAILRWVERSFHILNKYQMGQMKRGATAADLRMSFKAMALALGFRFVVGADGPTDAAKICGVSKACFDKPLNHFIEQLNLEPLPFQRKAEAREKMRQARKNQVKGKL